ncbi:Putative ribonuclease H protein At1g65750 [Linum perenne]
MIYTKYVHVYKECVHVYKISAHVGGACSFWFDFWVRGVSLSEVYPRIAAAVRCRDSFISDIVSLSPRRSWQIPLNNTLRGGAWREWQHLLNRLEELPEDLITEGPAFIVWPLEASARFSVASLRRQLVDESFPGDPSFPHSLIWIKEVPTKIQGFCWTTFHMKIASLDNLQKRGFQLANWCVLCHKGTESIDHMFIHCDYSSSVWNRLSSTLSIIGPRSPTIQ